MSNSSKKTSALFIWPCSYRPFLACLISSVMSSGFLSPRTGKAQSIFNQGVTTNPAYIFYFRLRGSAGACKHWRRKEGDRPECALAPVSYTHLRAHETPEH